MTRKICISLLLLSLLFVPSIGSAAEITTQELDRLETIFNQLESNNKEQAQKLERASDLLKRSENQINLLSEKLRQAELTINQAQTSLQRVNESLDKYEKEMTAKVNRLKFERNLLLIGLGVLAFR